MVTGDNIETATAIAKEANIIVDHNFERPAKGEPGYYIIMEGKEFRELSGLLVKDEAKDTEKVGNID